MKLNVCRSERLPYDECAQHYSYMGSMGDYPKLQYSMNAVRRAGKRLAENMVLTPESKGEILDTFAIANSWRDSHVYPMRSVRFSVIQRMRNGGISGFTAARPKRMSSIRKKLQRIQCQFDQINDLAGCRAVLDDIDAVNSLIGECRTRVPHDIRQEYPYIFEPKPDGYRSHHIVFVYDGSGEKAVYDGRRVELQVRTRLQHSWATAVEAVGLFRDEDLKAGCGDANWLRLFALMSAEFAHAERCPIPDSMPDRKARISEIRELNDILDGARVLENLKNATNYVQNFVDEHRSRYYLIRYDHSIHEVSVQTYPDAVAGSASLGELEQKIALDSQDAKAVLVEVDKIEKLVEAYPNYFGDVSLFIRNLQGICRGNQAIEYSMAPQNVVKPRQIETPDPSWLKRRHRRWTE